MKQIQITKDQGKAYVFEYPQFKEFADAQNKVFWLADEIEVEKDIQDIKVNMTEAEQHGVITVLKLFTLYELVAGDCYWGNRVMKTFPNHSVKMMASSFSFMELNVHAPFYNKLNEALHLNTEEFYTSYVEDPILKERMEFVEAIVDHPDPLVSIGTFTLVEGAVLYSSFAFLKHFQCQGKNKLLNVVRGINFSVRDENLHCMGGAALYKQLKMEMQEANVHQKYLDNAEELIVESAHKIREHEYRIVDMLFEKGEMEGITKEQMQTFIDSRINLCLGELGIQPLFQVQDNPISEWFYKGINTYQFNDFFTGVGNQYNRNWNETGFIWETQDGLAVAG